MVWLVGLLVLETILEGVFCAGLYAGQTKSRRALGIFLGAVLVFSITARCIVAWQVWIWILPFSGYRLINILRVYRARLPAPHLRTVALRAFGWLVTLQILIILAAWSVSYYHLQYLVLNLTVAAQLLFALALLRTATHTWQHALAGTPSPLAAKQLPTVSVLVPARNETDNLERCLQALVASEYPKLEVLVLDDCSADRRTPEIIRSYAHAGVRFLQGNPPDESRWLAKNYAYDCLAKAASGDVLLYCGVDALLQPWAIGNLIGLLEGRHKDMLSVMPLRSGAQTDGNSLLQAMRYYWEISLPRRFFKRPPVLSTCWLIRRATLERMGGFESVSRSISPEAQLARRAVVTDAYSFIRSDPGLGVNSNKPSAEQYGTSVRVRYPQLHRRLELVALASLFEVIFLAGPLIGLLLVGLLPHAMAYAGAWAVSLLCLFTTYGLVAVGAKLTNPWFGWLNMPVAVCLDIAILHISLWKYEFGSVSWKGRNVCIPVMRLREPT